MIRITSKKDGFRRAGLAHSGVAEYPEGHFTEQQLVLLRGEPMLLVEEVQGEDGVTGERGESEPQKKSSSGKKGQ